MFNGVGKHCNWVLEQLPQGRLLAIDAFRGIAIAAMILVNNPGSWAHVYPPLLHAKWHGWTPTDLVFPFFIFIVGISIHIVLARELAAGVSKTTLMEKAVVRMLKLFGLGIILAASYYNFRDPNYDWIQAKVIDMRFLGVLQRIGLVYLLTVLLMMFVQSTKGRLTAIAVILLAYWGMMAWVPYYDMAGNVYQGLYLHGNSLAAWVDHNLLGSNHLYYRKATPFSFDPEGLLSTLPAVASCISGVLVGQLITLKVPLLDKIKTLLIVGVACYALGEIWGIWFPVNKALWTSSYVVLTSGLAMLVLGATLWLVDVKGRKLWTAPFVVFGANAIAFFMFSGFFARALMMIPVGDTSLKGWLFGDVFQPVFGNQGGSLAFAISILLFSYWVMYQLYKRRIFFKV